MKTSQRILEFLEINGPSTVREISIGLDLTIADIRYHLPGLEASNQIVSQKDTSSSTIRGRPAVKFSACEQITSAVYTDLLDLFTSQMLEEKSHQQVVDDLFLYLVKHYSFPSSPIPRISSFIDLLNHWGVEAKWIASKNGPIFRITRNPYQKENPRPFEKIMDSLVAKIVNFTTIEI
jgi:hypothetical protein